MESLVQPEAAESTVVQWRRRNGPLAKLRQNSAAVPAMIRHKRQESSVPARPEFH